MFKLSFTEPNKQIKKRGIDVDSTLKSIENSDQNRTLESSQQRANREFIHKNSTMTKNGSKFIASEIFEKLDESVTGKTAIKYGPFGASTTSTRIAKTASELRAVKNSKPIEASVREETEADSTFELLPDEQFMAGMVGKNSTLEPSTPRANKRSHRDISSISKSTDQFVMIRISEADVNRLITKGHIRIVQGQLQYHDPNHE